MYILANEPPVHVDVAAQRNGEERVAAGDEDTVYQQNDPVFV